MQYIFFRRLNVPWPLKNFMGSHKLLMSTYDKQYSKISCKYQQNGTNGLNSTESRYWVKYHRKTNFQHSNASLEGV